ncbi:hypothetical protein J437_LFUL013233 [Ladona fulva]|uniref:Uncharacterized protein n=1 Tax=Ladona fulva TaxID=123851 RepID=A0A8K0K2D1_LADFU|nr:hypothetical protein J437_LFUL013233 [Ladona fulva]
MWSPNKAICSIALVALAWRSSVAVEANNSSLQLWSANITVESQKQTRSLHEYYDFIITEYSFKFWSVFMLVSIALLAYAALAATYYAKINPTFPTHDYDYDYYMARKRSVSDSSRITLDGLSVSSIARILQAVEEPPNVTSNR